MAQLKNRPAEALSAKLSLFDPRRPDRDRSILVLKKDLLRLCLLHASFSDTQESAIYAILWELCRNGYTEQYEGSRSDGPVRIRPGMTYRN